jgi:hypothetical protein
MNSPIILAFGRLRQEDGKLESSLGNLTLSQKKNVTFNKHHPWGHCKTAEHLALTHGLLSSPLVSQTSLCSIGLFSLKQEEIDDKIKKHTRERIQVPIKFGPDLSQLLTGSFIPC